MIPLPVLHTENVKYECTFGTKCKGDCCDAGEPPLLPEEIRVINEFLRYGEVQRFMRPSAAQRVREAGYVGLSFFHGRNYIRTFGHMCIFKNYEGQCALHALAIDKGLHPGEIKPIRCTLYPLAFDKEPGTLYLRTQNIACEVNNPEHKKLEDSVGAELEFAHMLLSGKVKKVGDKYDFRLFNSEGNPIDPHISYYASDTVFGKIKDKGA